MKKLQLGTAFFLVLTLCLPVFAAEETVPSGNTAYTIVVGETMLDIDDLPCPPYYDGDSLMVPLRKIGEALGYKVGWDSETKAITMDDGYIQKATLYSGTAAAFFEGHLDMISMSREIENDAKTIIHKGYTFVPVSFFEEFFNEIKVENSTVTISPSKKELDFQYTEQVDTDMR